MAAALGIGVFGCCCLINGGLLLAWVKCPSKTILGKGWVLYWARLHVAVLVWSLKGFVVCVCPDKSSWPQGKKMGSGTA